MSTMKSSTVGQSPASEPASTDITADTPAKAYGNRHYKPLVTPGPLKGPLLPAWLSRRFRRKDTHASR